MAFIVTPGQLAVRSEMYHQIGSMLSAGITLPSVLETLHKNPPSRSLRGPIALVLQHLKAGETFTGAVRQSGDWLPEFDVSLLEAGEHSGRLDASFKLLSIYYGGRAQMVRSLIGDLAYPLFVMHFAVFLMPLPELVLQGDLTSYLVKTLGVLAPIYAAVFVVVMMCQGRHGEAWRSVVEQVARFIPILGTARHHLALARLSAALEALINAGVSIINAWELAASASGSPALKRTVLAWRSQVEHGMKTPAEAVADSGMFPDMFTQLYRTGEMSGQLDETLRRLFDYYQEDGTRKMKALAQWIPRLVYFIIMARIAHYIISFYSNYFKNINNLSGS
jgi:type II secretory pathway component PulF